MVTKAPEAVSMFRGVIQAQWDRSQKGEAGAKIIENILGRISS
jgi:hypothetical protein